MNHDFLLFLNELNVYLYQFDVCFPDQSSFYKIFEDVEHYLMHCHKYCASRLILFDRLHWDWKSCLLE